MTSKKPLVTVIVPMYNAEKYIERCLKSVLRQSVGDFEILAVNDGSTDGTGEIVRRMAKEDKRIRYVEQENMGVAKTRNKAVKLARGEFIAFMDNDDYIDEDYLEKLLPKHGEDIVISGYRRPDGRGKIIKEMIPENTKWGRFVVPTPWAKVYKREFILRNKLEFLDNNIGEDIYFNLIGMLLTDKVRIINYVGYNWFYNSKSVSSTEHKSFKKVDIFRLLDSCYDNLSNRRLLEDNYEFLEFFFYRFIVWFLLYSCKGQDQKSIKKEYGRLFNWLEERFPKYRQNGLLRHGKVPGEVKSTRAIYKTFMVFHKLGLGETLIWIYAKI